MAAKKKAKNPSRRDFLFGGMRRLREKIDTHQESDFDPLAAATKDISADSAQQAKEAFVRGNEAYARADFEAAAPAFRQCVKLFPAHLEARKRLGYCLYRLDQFIQAKVAFEHVLRAAKEDNFCSLYLGLTFARMGKGDKAAKAWKGYYNIDEVRIMRELHVQMAMLESPEPPPMDLVVEQVEETIRLRKEELLDQQA